MDASSENGFKWILARLRDDLRQKHCSQALQEEIDDVLTQLTACSEAMAHAAQVEDAIASLQVNQSGGNAAHVRIRSPSVTVLLDELQTLRRSCGDKLAVLLKPFMEMPKDAIMKQHLAEKASQSHTETSRGGNIYEEVRKAFLKVQKVVAKQRGSDWITHAVELVREAVKSYPNDSAIENVGSGNAHKRAKKELKRSMLSELEPLRAALLDNAAENRDEILRFRKALKKLAKCNPGLHKFYEESEAVLSEKEQQLVAKEQRKSEKTAKEREAEEAAHEQRKAEKAARELRETKKAAQEQRRAERATKEQWIAEQEQQRADGIAQKKRKLPDNYAAPASTESAESTEPLPLPRVRELMIQCLREVTALGSHFTMESYDVNLSRITRATQSLSKDFTYDDASTVAINLFQMMDYVEKITQPMRRKNRILRLKAALKAMLAARYLPWSNHQKESASAYLAKCEVWLKELKQTSPSNDEETSEEASSQAKETPAPRRAAKAKQAANAHASSKKGTAEKTTAKKGQPAKTKQNEEVTPVLTHVRFEEQKSRELVASKSHVRFDD